MALALVVIGACGDSEDQAGDGEEACRPASDRLVAAIEEGLTVTGDGELRRAYIVRSDDVSKFYLVAADIQGTGLEGDGDIGVWATNSPDAEGLIYAVDGMAQEFSDWGDADKTDAAIDLSADGVEEARACVEG